MAGMECTCMLYNCVDHNYCKNLSLTSVMLSSQPTGDSKRRSLGDKPSSVTPNLKPKFLSVRKKPTAGSSTTALIFENRPR